MRLRIDGLPVYSDEAYHETETANGGRRSGDLGVGTCKNVDRHALWFHVRAPFNNRLVTYRF